VAVKIVRQRRRLPCWRADVRRSAFSRPRTRARRAARSRAGQPPDRRQAFEVTDTGDSISKVFNPTTNIPGARTLPAIVAGI